jgi:transposase
LTNKVAKGKKGTIVAMIAGTKAQAVIAVIEKLPLKLRNTVSEITLDMAANMGLIAKKCFPNATSRHRSIPCAKTSIRGFISNQ